jgi:hypothetical protein
VVLVTSTLARQPNCCHFCYTAFIAYSLQLFVKSRIHHFWRQSYTPLQDFGSTFQDKVGFYYIYLTMMYKIIAMLGSRDCVHNGLHWVCHYEHQCNCCGFTSVALCSQTTLRGVEHQYASSKTPMLASEPEQTSRLAHGMMTWMGFCQPDIKVDVSS